MATKLAPSNHQVRRLTGLRQPVADATPGAAVHADSWRSTAAKEAAPNVWAFPSPAAQQLTRRTAVLSIKLTTSKLGPARTRRTTTLGFRLSTNELRPHPPLSCFTTHQEPHIDITRDEPPPKMTTSGPKAQHHQGGEYPIALTGRVAQWRRSCSTIHRRSSTDTYPQPRR